MYMHMLITTYEATVNEEIISVMGGGGMWEEKRFAHLLVVTVPTLNIAPVHKNSIKKLDSLLHLHAISKGSSRCY